MSKIVELYVKAVLNGEKTIKEVPAKLREQVQAELDRLGE